MKEKLYTFLLLVFLSFTFMPMSRKGERERDSLEREGYWCKQFTWIESLQHFSHHWHSSCLFLPWYYYVQYLSPFDIATSSTESLKRRRNIVMKHRFYSDTEMVNSKRQTCSNGLVYGALHWQTHLFYLLVPCPSPILSNTLKSEDREMGMADMKYSRWTTHEKGKCWFHSSLDLVFRAMSTEC